MNKEKSCKDCTDRHYNCWATCPEYQRRKAQRDRIRELKQPLIREKQAYFETKERLKRLKKI